MIPIKYRPRIRQDGEGRVERDIEEPDDRLLEAFHRYFREVKQLENTSDELYQRAYDILEDFDGILEGFNELISIYDVDDLKEFEWKAGKFLTAAYNLCSKEKLVYDNETDYNLNIGQGLKQGKTLLLKSDLRLAGIENEGTVVNQAPIQFSLCSMNKGFCINYNYVGDDFAGGNQGLAINLGEVERAPSWGNNDGIFLNFGEINSLLLSNLDGTLISTQEFTEDQIDRGEDSEEKLDSDYTLLTPEDLKERPDLNNYLKELESNLRGMNSKELKFLDEIGSDPAQIIREKISDRVGDLN